MNPKMRVVRSFLVKGILIVGLALGLTCKRREPSYVTFGGPGADIAGSVQQTADGGFIIGGATMSYGAGGYDVWLIKTDSSCNKVWDRTFGGTGWDLGYSVRQTSDGGYVIAGTTESYGAGGEDVWLIKTDVSGNEIWDKTFGGTGDDEGNSVGQTSDGGYIVAGATKSFGACGWDVWLIKTDSSGNEAWDRTFGGTGNDMGYSVQQTTDGGYIVTGFTESSGGDSSGAWLIKTDASGNKVWDRTFTESHRGVGWSARQTSDGGYAISGSAGGAWLVKTDASGNKVWDKTFAGTDAYGYSVCPTSDGGYIIAGNTTTAGVGACDVLLIKTDSSGNKVWQRTFGGSNDDSGCSVQPTSDGGYIITGWTESYGAGKADVWLIKTDAEGN